MDHRAPGAFENAPHPATSPTAVAAPAEPPPRLNAKAPRVAPRRWGQHMSANQRTNVCAGLLSVIFALLLPACSRQQEQPAKPQPVRLKVVVSPYLGYAPFFIAQEEGYFTEQGLEVELIKGVSAFQNLPRFLQGDVDVYPTILSAAMLNAMARGANVRIVAGKGHVGPPGDTYLTLIARRELVESGKLKTAADLKGRRISARYTSTVRYYLETVLRRGGLSIEDVEIRSLPVPLRQEALARGAIDVASSSEPWNTRIVQSGVGVVWMPACDVIPGFQFAMVAYGPRLLEKDPDTGRRFMVAYLKAVRQYNEGKTERNLDIISKATKLDRDLLRQMAWSQIRSDGALNVESVLEFQRWAVAKGDLDRVVSAEEFWDSSFVDYANQILDSAD